MEIKCFSAFYVPIINTNPERMKDEVAVTFHDATLFISDVQLLHNEQSWLNDAHIHFYAEHLRHTSSYSALFDQRIIQILPPSLVHLIRDHTLTDTTMLSAMLPPDVGQFMYTLMPINDHMQPQSAGGTHWSWVVVDHRNARALHLDSQRSGNIRAARYAVERFGKVLGQHIKMQEAVGWPQQSNGYDCGAFVCVGMRWFLQRFVDGYGDFEALLTMPEKEQMAVLEQVKRLRQFLLSLS
jgi:Ulp1 family protease